MRYSKSCETLHEIEDVRQELRKIMEQNEQLISEDDNENGKLRHNAIDKNKHDQEIEIEGNIIPNVKEEHIILNRFEPGYWKKGC